MGNAAVNYNWGDALKVEVGDLTPKSGSTSGANRAPLAPLPAGRYAAFVKEIKHGTFKKGSYGLTVTYVIEEGAAKNRQIREYIVLTKADGTATPFGNRTMKRRLMSYGLSVEKINSFKAPRNEHDLGDFKLALSAPVTIIVAEDGEYEGKPSRKVKAVYGRAITE